MSDHDDGPARAPNPFRDLQRIEPEPAPPSCSITVSDLHLITGTLRTGVIASPSPHGGVTLSDADAKGEPTRTWDGAAWQLDQPPLGGGEAGRERRSSRPIPSLAEYAERHGLTVGRLPLSDWFTDTVFTDTVPPLSKTWKQLEEDERAKQRQATVFNPPSLEDWAKRLCGQCGQLGAAQDAMRWTPTMRFRFKCGPGGAYLQQMHRGIGFPDQVLWKYVPLVDDSVPDNVE